MTQHEERETKDGYLWSPTLYRKGATRGNAGVILLSCIVLDFDHADVGWPAIRDRLGGVSFIAYSTFQHTTDAPRFRVVLPLAEGVLVDHWADAWRRVAARFPECDPAAKDPARIYYLPAHPPGADYWTETK